MLLEQEAQCYFKNGLNIPVGWLQSKAFENPLSTQSLMKEMVKQIKEGKDKSEIAAWFHVRLVLAVQRTASKHHCHKICFSGGVFQNGLLVDLLIKILGKEFQLYFNKELSANDENISFGQLVWYTIIKQEVINEKV